MIIVSGGVASEGGNSGGVGGEGGGVRGSALQPVHTKDDKSRHRIESIVGLLASFIVSLVNNDTVETEVFVDISIANLYRHANP